MRWFRVGLVILVAFIAILSAPAAHACDCERPPPIGRWIDASDGVYVVRPPLEIVAQQERLSARQTVEFPVLRVLRGTPRLTATVELWGGIGSSCGIALRDEEYLLPTNAAGRASLSACDPYVSGIEVLDAETRFGAGRLVVPAGGEQDRTIVWVAVAIIAALGALAWQRHARLIAARPIEATRNER